MPGALDGVRVIDFGQYIAGPMAGMLLADQGAEVIKVDPPSGPAWDNPANATYNRGKRNIALNLKNDADCEVARALAEGADVVIENFRPGVMDRLGLSPADLTAANPSLIYLSLPGFAADDPRAQTRAYEGVIGAATALYRGDPNSTAPGRPVYTAIRMASTYAAIQGAVATVMALMARERDGRGQTITVPLFDAMFGVVGSHGLTQHDAAAGSGRWISLTSQYQCKDGRWVYFHTGNGRTAQVLEAAGVGTWVDEGVLDRTLLAEVPELAQEFVRRAKELFLTRTAAEWEELISNAGGECTVCRESEEWLQHPQALATGIIVALDDPYLGPMRQSGIPARLTRTPGAIRGPRSRLDADRESILGEVDVPRPPRPLAAQEDMRAALAGVKVVDMCMVLAGPACARTLAEYGAEVVKIDAPMRPPNDNFHLDVNRGKRDIVLHLGTPEGLEVFWRLVEDADVVVQNFRKGVAERLGVGYEQVRARKPEIIYASINMYGQIGPFAGRPGHEQIAQAATGMDARFRADGPPRIQNYFLNDYGTGFLGAYAVALGLLHRKRTGQGQHVDTALAYTATLLQSQFMQAYEGKRWDEPRGLDALGDGPLHRAYEAADGWFFLGARERDLPTIARIEGLSGIEGLRGASLAAAFEERFPKGALAEWVPALVAAGAGAHRVLSDPHELMNDPWVIEHGLSLTREHTAVGRVTTTGPTPRLSKTPVAPGRPAPPIGGDALDVLREIGMEDRLSRLSQAQGSM